MTPKQMRDLIEVIAAQVQECEGRMAKIGQQEQHARALLGEIDVQFATAATQTADTLSTMRGLGAHQAWVDFARRRRATINQNLALILAEKTECTIELRRLMGRRDALGELLQKAQLARKRKLDQKAQETALETFAALSSAP